MRWQVILVALLSACATTETVWSNPGSSQQQFNIDAGQCKAQAFGAPGMQTVQVVLIYQACMQGKGWQQIEVPKR